jgi:hypothetical protein
MSNGIAISVASERKPCFIEANSEPISICIPSTALLKLRSVPASPLSIVSAIMLAAPAESSIKPDNS